MAKTYRASYFYTSSNYSSPVALSNLTATPISMPVSSTYYVYMLMTCYDGGDFEDYCSTQASSSQAYSPRAISNNTGYVTVGSMSNVTVYNNAGNTFSAVKFTVTSTSSAAGKSTTVYTEDCQYQQMGSSTWYGCGPTTNFSVSVKAPTTYSITVDPQWTSSSYGYLYMGESYDVYVKVSGSDGSTPKPTVTSSSTSYATVAISSSTYTHNSSNGWYKVTITPQSTSTSTNRYIYASYSGATTQYTYFRIYSARNTDTITLHSNTSSPFYWTYTSGGTNMFSIYAKATSGQTIYFQPYDTSKATCDAQGTYVSSGTYAGYYRATVTCKATTSSSGMFFNVYTNGSTSYKPASITPTAYIRSVLTNPTVSGSYTYSGSSQTVSISNAPSSTIANTSGTFSATNAGSYTCSYTIKDSNMYVFANGENATELNWSIAKASQTITPHAALSGTVSSSGSAASTASSGLACTYSSSNTAVATVNASTGAVSYVGAGTCVIYVNQSGNSNYNAATQKSVSVTVSKNVLTVTADKTSWNYDGSTHIPSFTYSTAYITKSGTTTAQSAAGTYTTTFTISDTAAYIFDNGDSTKDISWTINKVAPTYTAPTTKSSDTYNGSAKVIGNAGSATGGTMYYQWGNANGPLQGTWQSNIANVTRTDAGTYYLWYYVKGDGNHTDTASAKVSTAFTINKATPSFTKTDGNSTYPSGATGYVKASVAGTVYYGTSTSSMTTTAAATANTNVAIVSVAANSDYNTSATRYAIFVPTDTTNYNSVGSASSGYLTVTAKVAYKAAGYINGLDLSDLTYASPNSSDATVATQSGTLTYNGSSQSPTWKSGSYSNDPTGGTSSATNAGTYSQTVSLKNTAYFSGGSKTRSITGASGTVTYSSNNTSVATVSKDSSSGVQVTFVSAGTATITVSVAASTNYNATSTSFVVSAANGKHIWSDGTTANKTVYWTINNHAGTGSASVSSLSYTAADSASIATPTQSNSLTYNAAPQSPTFNNNTTYCTISGGTASATNAGDYSRTASLTNAAFFAYGTKTFTISGNSGTLGTPTTSDSTVATASLSSSTVTVTFKKAGSATISVPVAAATNYDATTISVSVSSANGKYIWSDGTTAAKTVTWKINKANQTAPTATGSSTIYPDGATATATGGGGIGTLTWTGSGKSRAGTSIGSHTTTAYWSGDANYNASPESSSVTVKVSTRPITVNATAQSKQYDGSALSANNTYTIASGSVASGDSITVTGSGSTSGVNAGSTGTKSISVTIKDSGGTNVTSSYYAVTTNTATLSITKANATISSTDPSTRTFSTSAQTVDLSASATSGGTISFSTTITVKDKNNTAVSGWSITSAGRLTIPASTGVANAPYSVVTTITAAETTNYNSATTSKTYSIAFQKANQSWTLSVGTTTLTSGDSTTYSISGTTYGAVQSGVSPTTYASLSGTTITASGSPLGNTTTLTVTYPGNANYNSRTQTKIITLYTKIATPTPNTMIYSGGSQTASFSGVANCSATAGNTGTNAGNYTATFTTSDSSKYRFPGAATTKTVDWSISKRPININGKSGGGTYKGSDYSVSGGTAEATGTNRGLAPNQSLTSCSGEVSRDSVGTSYYTPSSAVIKDSSGTNTTSNYSINYVTNSGSVTVSAKAVTIAGKTNSKTYDGTALTVSGGTASGLVSGHTLASCDGSVSRTNYGTSNYTPSNAVIKDSDGNTVTTNYSISYTANSGAATINKAAVTPGAPSAITNRTYNAAAQTIMQAGSTTGGTYYYGPTSATCTSTSLITGTDAGDYVIYWKWVADDNHTGTTEPAKLATAGKINKRSLTVTANNNFKTWGENDPTLQYTFNSVSYNSGASFPTGYGSDKVTINLSRAAGTNVGSYDITGSQADQTGNYTVTVTKGTFSINKAEITSVAAPTNANPTYNGGDVNIVTGGGTSYGSYSYSSSSSGTYMADFMKKDRASSGYTVYWKFTPDGNHQLKSGITSSGSITANVAQRALTVSAVNKSKNYGAGDPTLQYTFGSGTYNSGTAFSTGYSTDTLTVTLSRASGETAGTYNITGTVSSNINYSVTVNKATFTINKVAGSFTNPTDANPTYNGSAKAYANAATNVVGGKVQYSTSSTGTYSDSLPTEVNAGTYTLYWKFVPDGNHTIPSNGTGSVTCHIAKATPTFSKIDGTAEYPNTASGVVAATVAGTVYYGTSSSSMTSTKAATADTGVTIVTRTSSLDKGTSTVYAYFVPTDTTNYNSVGSASSYALSVTATTTVGIVSLPNTTTESKVYNGANQSPTYTASKTGMTTSGDTSKKDVKSNYTITYTLTSTTNYKWSDNTTAAKTKSWSITAVPLGSISTPSDSSYTGSAQTPSVTVKATVNGTPITLTAGTDYTLSYSNNTNAGTATVTATGKGNFSGTKSANWTINKIAQPGTVTGKSANYGSTGALAAASSVAGSASVYYAVGTQLTDSNYSTAGSTTVPTASGRTAGNYTVYYYIPEVTNYLKKSGSVTGTVAKVAVDVTKLPAINAAVIYDGSAHAIGTAGTVSGGTLYYTYGTADAAQGSWATTIPTATDWRSNGYYLWSKVTADGNHIDVAPFKTDTAFMINKAAITVTAPAAITTLVYNGSAQTLCTTGTTTNGTMKYAMVTKGSTAPGDSSYSTSRPSASEAGDYTVYWKFAIDSNHSTTSTVANHFDVNIGKATATITLTQYSQNASVGDQIKVSDFLNSIVPNVTLTYTISTNGTTTPSTISGSTVTIGGMSTANDNNQTVVVSVTNPGNSNYNANTATYTITAKKKAQLAPTATGATETYPNVATATYSHSTIHAGTLTWTNGSSRSTAGEQSTQAYYARTNAYAESPKSSAVTLKVNQRTVTATMPTIVSGGKQWDNTASNTSTGGSVTAGGTMYYYQSNSSTTPAWDVSKWTTTRPSAKTVGTYYLWAYAYVSDTKNNLASTNTNTVKYIGEYTVTKRVLSIAWGTVTWTYDGTTHQADPVVSNKVDGYSCTVSYSGNSIKNAGTTTVTASIPTTDAGYAYYRLPSNYQATLTINKRATTTTITPSATSFTYGGTAATYTYADSNLAANQTASHMPENNPASTSTVGQYTVNSVTAIKDANGNDVTSNYTVTEGSTKVSVTIRTVSVTAPTAKSGTFTYNAGNQTLFNTGSASAGGTMYYKVTTSSTKPSFVKAEWSTSMPQSKTAGTYYLWYYVLVSDTTNNTYASQNTVLPASGTISKAIAVASVALPNTTTESFEYKKEQFTPAYTSATTGMYLDVNSVTSATNAGNYKITYKLTDSNYKWSDGTTTDKVKDWSITKKEVTLTWNATRSWVYDGSTHYIPTTVVTAGGLISGDTCTVGTTGNSVGPNVGTATVTANTLSNNNYKLPAANTTTISITKKELTVTASSHTVSYGDAKPTLSVSYSGFVNSEDASVLDTKPTASTTYAATTAVSSSPVAVTVSGGSDNNYSFKYVNGSITINKAQVTVTASSHTVTYGDAKPSLSVSYSGFKNGQSATVLTTLPTVSTTYTSSTSVANSPVTVTAKDAEAANYSFKYVDGAITINKHSTDVVVTGGGTYNYDAKAHNIHATASPAIAGKIYYGLAPDNLAYNTSVSAGSTGVDIGGITNVGSVSRFVQFVPTDTTNYSSSAVKGEYVVTINAVKATLPTTWAGDSKYFHETATVSASGQIGGTIYYRSSTTSATSGYGSWTTAKPTRTAVGTTWVQCYVKADTNHTDSSVSDAVTLTINKVDDAAMTVTLASNLIYNGIDQPIVTTSNVHGIAHFYVGLSTDGTTPPVDGAWLTDPASISKTPAGDYYVWYKFTADSSHSTVKNATYVGKVTIARRPTTTTITPSATSYIYGNAAPTYTYADSNLANNHTATHTASNAPGALTNYTGSGITVTATTVIKDANGNNVTSNYTVTNGNCTVTVNRRPIVINAPVNANVTYTGSAQYYCTTGSITANLPEGATSTGTWTYGTSSSSLTANRPQKTDAGTYTMYWKFDIGNNYYEQDHAPTTRAESGSVDGTIKQKAATITVNRSAASHVYGNNAVTYTFTTSGLVNSTDLGTITASGAPASKSTVGSYSVGASYTTNNNYSVTVTKASVSVTARPITITGGTKSKAYDGTVLTYNSASLTSGSLASGDTATYSSANGTTNKPIHVADGEITNVPSVVIKSGSTDVTTNYSITKTNGKLSITKAANGMATSKVTLTKYVNASVDISGYSANAVGAVNYAINTSSTTTTSATCNAETGAVNVGVCSTSDDTDKKTVLTITAAGSGDYNSATRTVEITVQKYVPVFTWDNNTTNLTYGATLSVKAAVTSAGGTVGTVSYSTVGNYTTISGSTLTGKQYSNQDSDTVTCSVSRTSTVKAGSTTRSIVVTKRTVTLTWGTKSWPYDGKAHGTTCTAGNLVGSDTCTVTLSGNSVTNYSATATTVTATALSNTNYVLPSTGTTTSISITKVELTVTGKSQTVTYATALSEVQSGLAYTISGFVNSETESVLTTKPSMSTNYTATTNAGTTGIYSRPSGAAATNYTFEYNDGTITIGKRTGSINIDGADWFFTSANNAVLTLPTQSNKLTYTGGSQSPTWSYGSYDSTYITIDASGTGNKASAVNAGDYTMTAKIAGKAYFASASRTREFTQTTGTVTVESTDTTVVAASMANSTTVQATFKKAGNATIKVKVAESTNYTAIEVPITVTVSNGKYVWSDGKETSKSVTWTIAKQKLVISGYSNITYTSPDSATLVKPTQNGTLTYNGGTQSPKWSNTHASISIPSVSGKNAETFTTTATLTGAKTYFAVKEDIVHSISVSASSVITITDGDSTICRTSYDTPTSTGVDITYHLLKAGTTTVSIAAEPTDLNNYEAAGATIHVVTANGQYIWSDKTTAPKSITWKIDPKPVTLTWGVTSWKYDATKHGTSCTANNVVSGDTCNVTLTGNSVGEAVGTATVSATALSNTNYTFSTSAVKSKTLEITPGAYIYDTGSNTWKPVKEIYAWDGTSWKRTKHSIYSDSTWKE